MNNKLIHLVVFLALLTLLSNIAFAQASQANQPADNLELLKPLYQKFYENEKTYVCKGKGARVVGWGSFDTLFAPILTRVVLNDEGVINNGDAYSLSFDKQKSNFSASYSWQMSKTNNHFLSLGLGIYSSESFAKLFSKDEWQKGITLTGTYNFIKNKSIFFTPTNCQTLQAKRIAATALWMNEYKKILEENITALENDIKRIDAINYPEATQNGPTPKTLEEVLDTIQNGSIDSYKSYTEKSAKIKEINELKRLLTQKKYDSIVDSKIADFEKNNLKEFGYSIKWWSVKYSPAYKGISTYDTTAARNIGINSEDYISLANIGVARNWFRETKNVLSFLTVGANIYRTNFLEGKKPDDIEFLRRPVGSTTSDVIQSSKAVLIDDSEKYKQKYWALNPNAIFNVFVGQKKLLGLELAYSTKIALNQPKDLINPDLFTCSAGLLFAFSKKDKLAKSVLGLIAKWEDLSYNKPSIADNFTLGLRIGVPFGY